MHGRLKIKTTAEQAAEKQKERDEKRKLYLGGLTKAFSKRSSSTYDEEGLKTTAQLLIANPDAATLWNFRREILLNMKGDDDEAWTKLLMGELSMIENSLMKNPKSYGAWHHRCWVMEKFPSPPWSAELDLCNRYLKLDERNFHCWDYRRFITKGSQQLPEDELKVSKQLIEKNLSNYSAWHYRSKLLPVVYPPTSTTPHPVPVDVLVKELKTVVEAVFTDPSDQSPWFFLRWLINRQDRSPRLLQVGYVKSDNEGNDEGLIVCVFSKALCASEAPSLRVNGEEIPSQEWYSPSGEKFSHVWVKPLSIALTAVNSITIETSNSETKTVEVPAESPSFVEWVTDLGISGEELSDLTRSTLEEVKENCVTLDELDPGNKWVLLTLVDILWALDAQNYQEKIKDYLSQLEDLDPLRTNYYKDMKSKLLMETTLTRHHRKGERTTDFRLGENELTRIAFTHLLSCFTSVDLRQNRIVSLGPLRNLVSCQELVLDHNIVSDITALEGLSSLRKLSLVGNDIGSVEQLKSLKQLGKLEFLDLSSNPICDISDVESELRQLLPSVKCIRVS